MAALQCAVRNTVHWHICWANLFCCTKFNKRTEIKLLFKSTHLDARQAQGGLGDNTNQGSRVPSSCLSVSIGFGEQGAMSPASSLPPSGDRFLLLPLPQLHDLKWLWVSQTTLYILHAYKTTFWTSSLQASRAIKLQITPWHSITNDNKC